MTKLVPQKSDRDMISLTSKVTSGLATGDQVVVQGPIRDGGLPNLVIAGVSRAATTSLFWYLANHPEIHPSDVKELRYFTPLKYQEPLDGIGTYTEHFKGKSGQRYAMEATPGYFSGGRVVAEAIDKTLPQARVIVSLREPVDRCWSYFKFVKSRVRIDKDMKFDAYLDRCELLNRQGVDGNRDNQAYWGLGGGCYSKWLEAWHEIFGDRLQVMFFDEIVGNPSGAVADVCRWLDLDPAAMDTTTFAASNKSETYRNKHLQKVALSVNRNQEALFRRHPAIKHRLWRLYDRVNHAPASEKLSSTSRGRLRDFYEPYNTELLRQMRRMSFPTEEMPGWLTGDSATDRAGA